MSGTKIQIGELADTVNDILQSYTSDVVTDGKKAIDKAANQARNEIKSGAPKRTGKYAASWATKTTSNSATSYEKTVYSKNRYQIAHLLEFGHAKRNGGRVAARTHIAPAEQNAIETLEAEIIKAVKSNA